MISVKILIQILPSVLHEIFRLFHIMNIIILHVA